MTFYEQLKENLSVEYIRSGYSLMELSRRCGVYHNEVSGILDGRIKNIKLSTVDKIAKNLNVSTIDLICFPCDTEKGARQ